MHFARQVGEHGRLEKIAHISTAYVCGDREGAIYENDNSTKCHFSNNYEQSKWEAECHVGRFYPDMPVVIFRPSIVVGDSSTGRLNLFNVLYTPLRFVCRGDLPVLRADAARSSILSRSIMSPVQSATLFFKRKKPPGKYSTSRPGRTTPPRSTLSLPVRSIMSTTMIPTGHSRRRASSARDCSAPSAASFRQKPQGS